MSAKKTWPVVIIVFLVILLAIGLGTAYYLVLPATPTIEQNTVVEIVLTGPLFELPPDNPLRKMFGGDGPSLLELGHVFDYAARDDRVAGVYMEIHPLALSWAQVEELRTQMQTFRASGKPLHAFLALDMVREIELYLASAADAITANPDTGLLVNGFLAEVTFYKHAMNKLDIRPQFIQFKEYKSPETFTRDALTPQIREMYESILRDLEDRFVSTVARDRGIEEARLREIMGRGIATAQQAQQDKLVDAVGHRDQVERSLLGDDPEKQYQGVSASRYLESARDRYQTHSRHRVALLGGVGLISTGHSEFFGEVMGGTTMAAHLRKIRRDDTLKGVIFRVDSPGGSAVGSDLIWKEVKLLEETGKPVIVSMSGVAGSGGYYISMGARRIVSQPSTITGSIGVIFGKFNVEGFYRWLGITVDRVKLSPNADLLSPFSSLTREQREGVESWMKDVYQRFVQMAAEGRKLEYDELERLARGRIYTGAQAKELGLVDDLGGLETAIDQMKSALHLAPGEEIELVLYPRRKGFWEALFSGDLFETRTPTLDIKRWLAAQFEPFSAPAPWLFTPVPDIY